MTAVGGTLLTRCIAVASVLAVTVIATVLALTAWYYRSAIVADQAIQGIGLGLAIVKAIVEAHDGVITVESVEGEGTVFRVELPLTAVRQPVAA